MYKVIEVVTSGVSGKTKKGGQSQRRYERLRQMHLNDYYKRVAEHAKKDFLEDNNVVGLVVSGPGPTKETFLREGYLDYRLQKKVIATIDCSYVGSEGIRETLDKMTEMELFKQNRTLFEKQLVDRFMKFIDSNSVYGLKDVLQSIKTRKAKTVIALDTVKKEEIEKLEDICLKSGIDFEVISSHTESGVQFMTFGGIGAIDGQTTVI